MKIFKLTTALMLATTLLVAMSTQVLAQEASQEQQLKTETEVVCETGSYGQQTCTAKAKAEGEQKQTIKVGDRVIKVHQPVNAGLDTIGLMTMTVPLLAGTSTYVLKRKLA